MNMPPKNITSVTRNTHIPSVDASSCCSIEWKCGCSFGCGAALGTGLLMRHLHSRGLGSRRMDVVVGVFGDHRRFMEIVRDRRRLDLPLEARGAPRIRRRQL